MSTEITINQDIVEINVTEEVITIEAPSGAYPLPSLVNSVFGRVGNVVAQEGDYTLTQIGDVTLTSPSNGQVLKYNGTAWVNSSDTDTGLTSVGLSMPSAFSVANSPLTANGTLSVTGAGTTAQYVRGDGSLATLPSLTGFVPYTGATADVDLGTFDLTADVITGATGSFASSGGSNTFAINHSSGSGIALNITKGGNGEGLYINKTSGSGNAATIIGTLNATTLVKSGGTSSQYLMADGSVSTLTNNVTGTGTTNTLPKFTGASTIGNSNVTDSGTLITLGSNSFVNGALGIGTSSIDGNLNITRNLTGFGGNPNGIYQNSTIQSDVNGSAIVNRTLISTQAASFTLVNLHHYFANQGTFGAGSVVTNQTGFFVTGNLIGATNNYGFYGNIPVGTNRWNLFMNGTANNYLAGNTLLGTTTDAGFKLDVNGTARVVGNTTFNASVGIGTTSLTGYSLRVSKNITGATTSYGVLQEGTIQSDVTSIGYGFYNALATQAATFTLSNYSHFFAIQTTLGAGSSVQNQAGFRVHPTLIAGINNYAFQGQIPSGANRWNIYMDGTANNYMAGGLGIGSTNIGGGNGNINIARNITGNAFSTAIWQNGTVQSDVTGGATSYQSDLKTVAASFTLTEYIHYLSNQITIGAGSAVTNQSGFYANSNLIGATNNYGFRGRIPVGTGRWNLYMDGMAANYLAGDTAIGTTTLGTATQLTVGGTETAVSAISRGQLINTTLVASANSDVLVGLDIAPTFTNGAFTGVQNIWLRAGTVRIGLNGNNDYINFGNQINLARNGEVVFAGYSTGTTISSRSSSTPVIIALNQAGTTVGQFFGTTGNFTLQNGGTFTDAGFRLDVNGVTRIIGTASTDAPPLGSELLTTSNWTSTGWTGDFTTGFTHTTGNTSVLSNTLAAVIGTYYKIQITMTGRTAGSIDVSIGGQSRVITNTRSIEPLATTTGNLTITPTSDFNGTIIVSVRTIGLASPSLTITPSIGAGQITMRATNVGNNTVIGLEAGQRLSSSGVGDDGTNNTFIGFRAGRNSTNTRYNTFIGAAAGELTSTGTNNTAVGRNALYINTTGIENTALGEGSGINNNGIQNTFIGTNAGFNNTTGFNNLFVGYNAGRFITGGVTANTIPTNSIFIGRDARAAADGQGHQIVIGNGTTGLGGGTTIIGNTNTTLTALYGSVIANGTSINASAVLQADSTTKGFLPPRMTTTQKLAIASPATGLVVFDTTLGKLCVFAGTWQTITSI
jgi:hypothetical protein